ncbi:MAG: sulfotransferase domain-containing protein [Chloroflexota bacterium]
MDFAQYSFIMIGGTTRAGTTSLYKYLSDHKDVSAASQKETRFFLDADYPSPYPISFRHDRDPIEKYFEYFADRRKICMEATPDYLYSPGTPERVKKSLGDVKWIFILRDPIERLISWFHFGRQMGELTPEIGLQEFVTLQLNSSSPHPKQVFRTLQQGCYSTYLRPFYDLFGRENVLLLSFGALEREPMAVMKQVCGFAGIDSSTYEDYNFSQFNASRPLKRVGRFEQIYNAYAVRLYLRVYNKPRIRKVLRFLKLHLVEPLYYRIKVDKNKQEDIAVGLRRKLEEYYAGELERLSNLCGQDFSWE